MGTPIGLPRGWQDWKSGSHSGFDYDEGCSTRSSVFVSPSARENRVARGRTPLEEPGIGVLARFDRVESECQILAGGQAGRPEAAVLIGPAVGDESRLEMPLPAVLAEDDDVVDKRKPANALAPPAVW